jgi:hypothetical protein
LSQPVARLEHKSRSACRRRAGRVRTSAASEARHLMDEMPGLRASQSTCAGSRAGRSGEQVAARPPAAAPVASSAARRARRRGRRDLTRAESEYSARSLNPGHPPGTTGQVFERQRLLWGRGVEMDSAPQDVVTQGSAWRHSG